MKVTDIWFSRLRLQHFGFWHEGLTLKLLGWLNPKHKQSHAGDTEGSQETGPLKSHKFLCPWAAIRNHGVPYSLTGPAAHKPCRAFLMTRWGSNPIQEYCLYLPRQWFMSHYRQAVVAYLVSWLMSPEKPVAYRP